MSEAAPVLEARGVRKVFGTDADPLVAVESVDVDLFAGETVAVVGESGSGKSTLARCLLRLIEPTAGTVTFDGRDIASMGARELRALRADFQVVFQDPRDAMNPKMRVGQLIEEPLIIHRNLSRVERRRRVDELLAMVELPSTFASRRPRTLSGGQLQRVGIARALSVEPRVLVLDEPVSALDQSVRSGILRLLDEIQQRHRVGYLHISHDLASLRRVADRVIVMRRGHVVERGPTDQILDAPQEPYTQLLVSSVITIDHDPGQVHADHDFEEQIRP